ncbi:hypothetical protein [Nitrobacter sp.]
MPSELPQGSRPPRDRRGDVLLLMPMMVLQMGFYRMVWRKREIERLI